MKEKASGFWGTGFVLFLDLAKFTEVGFFDNSLRWTFIFYVLLLYAYCISWCLEIIFKKVKHLHF